MATISNVKGVTEFAQFQLAAAAIVCGLALTACGGGGLIA
jgi:hypothetical protein